MSTTPRTDAADKSCWKCQSDVEDGDKFCRHCGAVGPADYMSWDWREQPDLTALNPLLKQYGCKIEELETGTDQHAVSVVKTTK